VHVEVDDTPALCQEMRGLGLRVGLVVNPETQVEETFPFLDLVDLLLVMSVHPGFGGQAFIEDAVPKVAAAREEIDRRRLGVTIQVDGGIAEETAAVMARAGARCFVAGSAVFEADDHLSAVRRIAGAAEAALGRLGGEAAE
jgi:ribulose-phosphate 3-epimerase